MTKCSQKKCFLECRIWFQGFEGEKQKIEKYIVFATFLYINNVAKNKLCL